MKAKRVVKWLGIVLGIVVLSVLLFVAFFDWNMIRGFVNEQVSEQLGRQFAIKGDLDVDLGLPPRIQANDVYIANTDWGSRPNMAHVEEVSFSIRLLPLLTGRIVVPSIGLSNPDILLEQRPQGQANWQFPGLQQEDEGPPPKIGQLNIENGAISYRDPATQTNIQLSVETRAPETADGQSRLVISGEGRYQGEAFSLSGEGGSLLSLRDPDNPYPLRLEARAGKTRVTAQGTIKEPLQLGGMSLDFTLSGQDVARLKSIIDLPFPQTPPYELQGQLKHSEGMWRFEDFSGRVGSSQLSGNIAFNTSGQRPQITGDLVSKSLDLEDLSGLLGAKPGEGLVESAEERGRLLPAKPYDLPSLRSVDANIDFRAPDIKAELPVSAVQTQLQLDDGVLSLQPVNATVAGGQLEGNITLRAREAPASWDVDLSLQRLDLSKFVPEIAGVEAATAQLGARIKLQSKGNSIAQIAAHANGELGIVVTQAEVSRLLVSLASLDIMRTIASFLGDPEQVPLHCAVANFNVNNGVMKTQTFVIDSAETNFYGQGSIMLGKEKFDLKIFPRPEDPTLSLRAPLTIGGSFIEPDVGVEEEAVAKGAAALALGAIVAPLAALVPLVDPGPGEERACGKLIERVTEDVGPVANSE